MSSRTQNGTGHINYRYIMVMGLYLSWILVVQAGFISVSSLACGEGIIGQISKKMHLDHDYSNRD